MRTLALLLLAALALAGQEVIFSPEPAAAPPPEEAPPAGLPFHGYIDFGWRFLTDINGNRDVYKSVVNIDDGPTLVGANLVYNSQNNRWLDRLRLTSTTWGAYPYSSVRMMAEKDQKYRLDFDYRDMEFFSFVPTNANPLLASGVLETQFGWDMDIRSWDVQLTLRPNTRIEPYLAWSRGDDGGSGVRNLVLPRNQYTLPFDISASSNNYRGGLRLNFERSQFTFEGGYLKYREDTQVFIPEDTVLPIFGSATAPVFGGRLFLTSANEALGLRGNAPFVRGLMSLHPVPWATVSGAFLFSQPESKVDFIRDLNGQVVSGTSLASAELLLTNSYAIQPHPTGDVSVDIRPLRWLRIVESFMTDRLHVAGTAFSTDTFTGGAGAGTTTSTLPGLLVVNYNRNDLNAFVDLGRHVVVRGGYRRNWGDTVVPPSIPAAAININREFATLEQNVGIAGITYRPGERLRATLEYEHASSDNTYFRTSLADYDRVRSLVRYQLTPSLEVGSRFNYLNNVRPRPPYPGGLPLLDFEYTNWEYAANVAWTPQNARYMVIAEYGRIGINSRTDFINPATFDTILSTYDEDGNAAVLLVETPLWQMGTRTPKLSFGGSLWKSDGTRDVNYYRPQAKLWLPITPRVDFHLDWQWFGFSEPMFPFENFHAHSFVTALRIKL
ncbi:MAG: hypothetical protein ACM3ZB_06825 [bacterium]|jgi:hypothetical protein